MSRLFYKFPVSTDPLKLSEMELEDDDDLRTMIAIYCPCEIENPSPIELFTEITKPDPIQVVIQASALELILMLTSPEKISRVLDEIHPEVLATIEDIDEGSDNDDRSHRDPNDDFSDPIWMTSLKT
ncbi:hypothetical protein J1N35_024824 [Gossypium stocksii]|uniref:Uncharacterized protein n=1 Tax=Gossypium stocksii TaxID=47602 RepID=A0A9D3ZX35_9ROSI|nr:hypothetical protein J1N35_024824 [Gossypium stocksii]